MLIKVGILIPTLQSVFSRTAGFFSVVPPPDEPGSPAELQPDPPADHAWIQFQLRQLVDAVPVETVVMSSSEQISTINILQGILEFREKKQKEKN